MYAAERLLSDAAYLANQLHWSLDAILDLEHGDREFLIAQVEGWHSPVEHEPES